MNSQQPLSAAEIWETAYGELELQLPRETFNTWLRDARLVGHEDGTFIIGVKNVYAREWLEHRLKKMVTRTIRRIAMREVEVRFVLAAERRKAKQDTDLKKAGPLLANLSEPAANTPRFEQLSPGETGLNARQTFKTFAAGAGNRLAYAAARAVVDSPASQFNPLYIHSGVGLGKSHLLHAIGNAGQEQGYRVLYVSSETFTNDLVAAIQTKRMRDFRNKYRQLDILLIDDIQFLAGKESTQEEFSNTFNTLIGAHAQVIIGGDRAPSAIKRLDPRLRSRFDGGLVVELQPPDYLTRVDILEIKTDLRGFTGRVSLDVLERIAEQVEGSVRDLEGALNRIVASSLLTQGTPSLEETEAVLAQVQRETAPASVSMEDIIMTVAEYYGVSPEDISGRGRSRDVSTARQVAMYLGREEVDIPLQQIGELLGGRNHSTVLYSCERIDALMQTDSQIRRHVKAIRRMLQPNTDSKQQVTD